MDDEAKNHVWPNSTEYRSYYNLKILGYIDSTCFAIILLSNALVILVFTKKRKFSPMDVIFIHIAAVESLAALAYVPHVIHELFQATLCSIPEHRTYKWEQISLHSYSAAFLFRAIAVWLGVMLAVWRYITVLHPMKARNWCNMKITHILVTVGYIFSILISIPAYLCRTVRKSNVLLNQNGCFTTDPNIGENTTIYEFQITVENHSFLYTLMFFSYSMFQLLPPVVFAVISVKLIVALYETKRSNEEMCLNSHHYFRTTIILVVIFILFAMSEIPHGVFALLSALKGSSFFWDLYFYAMEICNCVVLISESFNFIIYYSMSNQFRQTFKELIGCTSTSNNETGSKIKAVVQRNISASSGLDKSLGIGNRSSISRDVN